MLHKAKVVLLIILLIGGFACSSTSAIDDDVMTNVAPKDSAVSIVQSDGVSLYQVRLREKAGTTVISGKLRTTSVRQVINGHIDVDIESRSGKIVYSTSVKIDRHITHRRHRARHPHFRAELQTIPAGANVRVSYHQDASGETKGSVCEKPHCP